MKENGQEQVLRFSSLESTLPCLISLPVDSEKRNLGQIRVILELMLPMLHVMTQALLRENNRHCRDPGGFFGFALQKPWELPIRSSDTDILIRKLLNRSEILRKDIAKTNIGIKRKSREFKR